MSCMLRAGGENFNADDFIASIPLIIDSMWRKGEKRFPNRTTNKQANEPSDGGMQYLGFKLSEIQSDIAVFMQYGQNKRMVQAQRGQAKSTLAALYCIWLLIHKPSTRVLIVSGGGDQADAISILVVRIIMNWSILAWLRPDTTKGDRDSTKNFDVHGSLKGIDKSASVSSVGITANLQGKRADFILADDKHLCRL